MTDVATELLGIVARLEEKGLNHGSSGNVSCRIPEGMLITPTGGNTANMTPDRLVRMSDTGAILGEGIPSSEWDMHLSILNAYPEIQAVVHTHADHCVALSCLRRPLPAFHYMVAGFGGSDVRCAPYATFGTRALAQGAVEALRDRKACLLANHGMIAMGKTLQQAFDLTLKLETLAKQYLLALQSGEPVLLPEEEMARVRERYAGYGRSLLPAD